MGGGRMTWLLWLWKRVREFLLVVGRGDIDWTLLLEEEGEDGAVGELLWVVES